MSSLKEQSREELPKRTQHISDLAMESGIFEDQSKELIVALKHLFDPKILLVSSKMLTEEDAYDLVTKLELINNNIGDLIDSANEINNASGLDAYEDPSNID